MSSIFTGQAAVELRKVKAEFEFTDTAILVHVTGTAGRPQMFRRVVEIPYTDSIGSLVDAESVRKACREVAYRTRD